MALPNLSINPYVAPYTGGLSKELGESISGLKDQYYKNAELDDILSYQMDTLKNHILPIDHSYAEQVLDKHRLDLSERAKKGDYENMFRTVRKSARDFAASAEPLMQRAQQRAEYIKGIKENKDIGEQTKKLAIQYSDTNLNKAFNPVENNNSYQGFNPSKDQNTGDILHKYFGDNFKGDKYVNEIIDPITGIKSKVTKENNLDPVKSDNKVVYFDDATGNYNTDGVGRKITQIELSARQHLQGHKEFKDYYTTQTQLGNGQAVHSEINNAINGEVQRLGYNIQQNEIDTIDSSWLKRYNDKVDISKPFESFAEVPTENMHINPKFTEFSFNPNGRLSKNTELLQANKDGSYSKFYDINGKQISLQEKNIIDAKKATPYSNYESPKDKPVYKEVKASKEEQDRVERQNNEEFDQLVKDTYLAQRGLINISPNDQNIALVSEKTVWDNPTYKKKVLNAYNESVKQFKTTENELWGKKNFATIKEISDFSVPSGEKGADVLSKNLLGRTIDVLSNDPETGIKRGVGEGVRSIDTVIKALEDKGYYFKNAITNGLLKINPVGNMPASSVTLEFKDEKGQKIKYINVAVGIGNADKKPALQIMQKVGQAYLSGNGGFVPIPGLGKGGYKVINIPGQVIGAPVPFVGLVQAVDSNGNNVGKPIPIQDWQDEFINKPGVKAEANTFLLNK